MNNARLSKNKSRTHDDRNGGKGFKEAEHIDKELSKFNRYYYRLEEKYPKLSFKEAIKKNYEILFKDYIEYTNEKAQKNRQYARMTSAEKMMEKAAMCPEDQIIQIGTRDNSIKPDLLAKIFQDYIAWEKETFPQVKILTAALHVDEPGAAPHIHVSKVWTATDKRGLLVVSQTKSLEQMGLMPPKSNKNSRFNNAKITYTAKCRAKLQEIAMSYGLEIEVEPREASKSGRKLEEFKLEKIKEEIEANNKVLKNQKIIVEDDGKKGLFKKNKTITADEYASMKTKAEKVDELERTLERTNRILSDFEKEQKKDKKETEEIIQEKDIYKDIIEMTGGFDIWNKDIKKYKELKEFRYKNSFKEFIEGKKEDNHSPNLKVRSEYEKVRER